MVELIVVMAIIAILLTASVVILNPEEKKRRARDNKRFSDLNLLDRTINEYVLDTGFYPDSDDVLRDSTTLPAGNSALDSALGGWIDEDISDYTSRLPLDPINDSTYLYSYYHDESSYELNAVLEYFDEFALDDGGNDPDVYEIGNNLSLISP